MKKDVKRDANFYRRLFGRVPPAELTKPIKEIELFARAMPTREQLKRGERIIAFQEVLEQEREHRSAVLREFLECESEAEVLDVLKQLLFSGFHTAPSRHPRARETEINQFAALLALGFKEQTAAQIIAKRQGDVGLDGKVRKWKTIKRDFQDTKVKKGWGEFNDPAEIALLRSGLLDDLQAAAKQHTVSVIYFPETGEMGAQHELGPLQGSIAMTASIGNGSSAMISARTLPDEMRKALWDHFAASLPPHPSATASDQEWEAWKVAHRAGGYSAVVVAPPGSNSGPIYRDILVNIGLGDTPLIEATGPLSGISEPAVVVFKNEIPRSVREKVNARLAEETKARHRLIPRTGMSAQKAGE